MKKADYEKLFGCTVKYSHYNLDRAFEIAKSDRLKTGHVNIFPYKCDYCPAFHIGHFTNFHKKSRNKLQCGRCDHWIRKTGWDKHDAWHNAGNSPDRTGLRTDWDKYETELKSALKND